MPLKKENEKKRLFVEENVEVKMKNITT